MALFSRLTCALVVLAAATAAADEFVGPHFRSNGKFVDGYFRSDRDGIFENNWSTKPNIHPYTGKMGTRVTPPNRSRPLYFGFGSFALPSTPAAPRSPIARTSYYGPASIPSVPSFEDREAAEAVRAAEIAATAKAYNDAKAQALAAARVNSGQRRTAFRAELDAERSKSAAGFEAKKAEIVSEHARCEPAAIDADKAELRTRYRDLLDQFDREQAATNQRFNAAITDKRKLLNNYYDDRQSISAALDRGRTRASGEPSLSDLLRDEQREIEQKLESNITGWTSKFNNAAASDRIDFAASTAGFVHRELCKRIERRQAERDQRLSALKAAHDQELGQRIAKLESEFERAEGERFVADQERAERRFLAYVHGKAIDSALKAEPVAYNYPVTSSEPTNGAAVTVALVASLGLLLAIGAVLSARCKPTDFGPSPQDKR